GVSFSARFQPPAYSLYYAGAGGCAALPSGQGACCPASPQKELMMGFFSKILEKLGMGGSDAAPAPSRPPSPAPAPPPARPTTPAPASPAGPAKAPAAPPPPQPVALVDVVAQMEARAAANPQKLNWRTSIVDLLKLLDIDSSLAARKELATELGCPPELME